jgi:4-aminobutyrate aminotransferase-like enzyme
MGRRSSRAGLGSLGQAVTHLPYPDPYRSPLGRSPEEVASATLALLDTYLGDPAGGGDEVAAVIIEPVQGNGGMIPAPAGFLSGLRQVCDDHGVLLIIDEVMSGFCRTGKRFAFEHDAEVRPDIVILAKSISAGLPLAGCLVQAAVAARNPSGVESSTYAGNLVSCAAALAALRVYDRDGLAAAAEAKGTRLLQMLEAELGEHPHVGEIRGRGLMVGVELVADRDSRAPLAVARRVSDAAVRRGLLIYPAGHHGNVLGLLPPLVITEEQLTTAVPILARAIDDAN